MPGSKNRWSRAKPIRTDTTYIIDADVQLVDGVPKGYVVTRVHRVIEGGE